MVFPTAKAKELKFRRRGESTHPTPLPPAHAFHFYRTLDRSLGHDSRRGIWSLETSDVVNLLGGTSNVYNCILAYELTSLT